MLRTAIAIILLAAGVRAQQVGVPTGGTLGPSSNLSDASTLNSDKVDGKHGADLARVRAAADLVTGTIAGSKCLHTSADGTQILETSADCGTGGAQADWNATSGAAQILNKPALFPPTAHTHGAADTVSGTRTGARCLRTSGDGTQVLEAGSDCGSGGGSSIAIDCSAQAGTDVGAKLQACATAAAAAGAAADASRLSGHVTVNRTISTAGLKIVLGANTITVDPGATLTFTGDDLEIGGAGDASLIASTANDSADVLVVNSNRAHLHHFKIVGNRAAGGSKNNLSINPDGVPRSGIVVDHVTSQDSGGQGIKVKACQHCTFESNVLSKSTLSGFFSDTATDLMLRGNTFLDNAYGYCGHYPKVACNGHGQIFFSSTSGTQYNIHVLDNYLANASNDGATGTGSGMQINGVQGLEVRGNTVINANGAEGIAGSYGKAVISDNYVDGGAVPGCVGSTGSPACYTVGGILLWIAGNSQTDIIVANNRVVDSAQFGIKVDFGADGITAQDIDIHDNRAWQSSGGQQQQGFLLADTNGYTGVSVLNSVRVHDNDFSANGTNAVKTNGSNSANVAGNPYVWGNHGSPNSGMGTGTLATCDANLRGRISVIEGASGSADIFQVCLKNAANAYAHTSLGGGAADYTAITTDVITSPAGSTLSAPRSFGVTSALTSGQATRVALDAGHGVQTGYNLRSQVYSYNGVEILGQRRSTTAPDMSAAIAATATDPALNVIGTTAGARVMRITGASGQAGDLLQIQRSDGSNVLKVDKDGNAVFGSGSGGAVTASADMVDTFHANELMTGVWSGIVNYNNTGVAYYTYWTPSRPITLKWIEVRAQTAGSGGSCNTPPQIAVYQNGAQTGGAIDVPINGSYAKLALGVNVSDLINPLTMRLIRADNCTNHAQFIHTSVTYEMNQ